ncbi:MAG: phosphoesterase, partial [Campylobacterales bacterium]|nr:phosphoesterase [Campylobacterales bacterium]
DDNIHNIKKEFFKKDKNDTLDNLATKYIVELQGALRSTHTIYYKGYKGFLSYGVGNTSIIGNGFLTTYPDYDFIVDVSYRGTMSLRANNKVSVATIAKEWVDGGGHPNASGGRIQGFKEQYRFDKVKEQIEKLINDKEAIAGTLEYKKE